jgi:hypothetical protein
MAEVAPRIRRIGDEIVGSYLVEAVRVAREREAV